MIRFLHINLCALIFSACVASNMSAFAADGFSANNFTSSGRNSVPEPSQEPPPLPEGQAPALPARNVIIPPLPLSTFCKQVDIEGLWKLQHVYEDPAGATSAAFLSNPLQYIYFKHTGVYGKYNGDGALTTPALIVDHIDKHATGLQQYLLQPTGIMYFYQDKIANDTQTCFTVLKRRDPFLPKDMLLMPPKGQITGRLIKHYSKVIIEETPPDAADAIAPDATAVPDANPAPVATYNHPHRPAVSAPSDLSNP